MIEYDTVVYSYLKHCPDVCVFVFHQFTPGRKVTVGEHSSLPQEPCSIVSDEPELMAVPVLFTQRICVIKDSWYNINNC